MPALQVDDVEIVEEEGFFDAHGTASAFFYYRACDYASDILLDAVDLGPEARRAINQSTYSATGDFVLDRPVRQGEKLRFEVTVPKIGGKSLTYQIVMLGAEDGIKRGTYTSVAVCMDMTGPSPKPIPDAVREKLMQYQ